MVGEVELDVNLGMTVIGEVLVVEWPEVGGKVGVGQVERMIPAVGEVAEIHALGKRVSENYRNLSEF